MSRPTMADTIREQVRKHREARRWTQEQLAEAVSALGVPLHPTAVTRIEKGSRKVTLEELIALARVFGLWPAALALPLGQAAEVELLPGDPVPTWDAAKWWMGDRGYPADTPDADPADWWESNPLFSVLAFYRDHDTQVRAIRTARQLSGVLGTGVEQPDKAAVERLRDLRKNMRRAGVVPPSLPHDLEDTGSAEDQEGRA